MKHLVKIQQSTFVASAVECVEIHPDTPKEVDVFVGDDSYTFGYHSEREAAIAAANFITDLDLCLEYKR